VICIDDDGRVTYFNESAERTFGYQSREALGQELADVIVPQSQRNGHRQGLARYLGTGEASILGRRIELTAMRSDGTEFPVELTVTRTQPPDEPGFTGFVRDITERVRAEEELRAARARAQLVADEQASLRRVATLVARQATPDELFAVVAEEVAHVLGVRFTALIRYDAEGIATAVGVYGEAKPLTVGASWPLSEAVAARVIWQTRQPARVDVAKFEGTVASALLDNGLRFATGAPIVVEDQLWGAMLAFESEDPEMPPEAIGRLQGFTELVATAIANATARSQLIAARRRVIEAADAARERVTRDIHDGAQQQLVNSLINLELGQQKFSSNPGRARELLDLAVAETERGIEALRELAAGIHPAILSDMGLAVALDELAARVPIPVVLDVPPVELPVPVEASVYFFCSEALTNVVKHASATTVWVSVARSEDSLTVQVRDDGVGGAAVGAGSGLVGLSDRIGALEGKLELSSPHLGAGTAITARIPLPT
jgi:PAS domain S-box-containing protein